MTSEAPTMTGLLQKGEDDFEAAIKAMPIKTLMDAISGLQKEMAKEQENFNSLSGELQNRKEKNSRQSKQISKDMMASQQRLTMLMNRSMKCFAQQNATVTKGTQLKRRNSAKGLQPVVAPAEKSATNIQRSRSMHSVNQQPMSANTEIKNGPAATVKPNLSILKMKSLNSTSSSSASVSNNASNKSNNNGVDSSLDDKNKNHTPIIMKPSMNGRVASARNMDNNNDHVVINSNNSNSGNASTTNGDVNNTASSELPTGGIYLKKNQQQQQQQQQQGQQRKVVATTTNFSPALPTPSLTPTPSITIASPSPSTNNAYTTTTANLAATTTNAMLPPKAPLSRSTQNLSSSSSVSSPSSAGKIQILQTKQRRVSAYTNPSSNSLSTPMLMSQSRPGLSKSQIIGQTSGMSSSNNLSISPSSSSTIASSSSSETNNPSDEFRGLPNVKMLARSFGSNTALNNTSSNPTNYTSGHVLSPGSRGVSRSTSSVCFGQSKNPHAVSSSNRIFLSKKTTNITPRVGSNSTTGVMNGGSQITQQQQKEQQNQQQHQPQKKLSVSSIEQVPVDQRRARSNSQNSALARSASNVTTSGPSELEQARARLKSNRNSREVLEQPPETSTSPQGKQQTNDNNTNSNNTTNINALSSNSATSENPTKSSTISEANSVSTSQSSKANGIPETSNGTSTSTTTEQESSKFEATSNKPPPEPQESTTSTVSSAASNSTNVAAPPRTGGYVKKSGVQGVTRISNNASSKPPSLSTSSYSSSNTIKSTATLSVAATQPPDPGSMRRSKSREELQSSSASRQQQQKTMPDRGSLLKQIQARRVDNAADAGGGSNVQSMAKLSRSMPSLFAAG